MNSERRTALTAAGGLVAALMVRPARAAAGPATAPGAIDTTYSAPGKGLVTGRGSGDFDFLAGSWAIRHRKRKAPDGDQWTEFESRALVHRLLDGAASVEELRNPDGTCMGLGIRTWHAAERMWSDHWTSAANGVVNPPQMGQFIDGQGVFVTRETVDGVDWQYRGIWDRITPQSCRWHQSSSADGGKTWTWDWWMEWRRA